MVNTLHIIIFIVLAQSSRYRREILSRKNISTKLSFFEQRSGLSSLLTQKSSVLIGFIFPPLVSNCHVRYL